MNKSIKKTVFIFSISVLAFFGVLRLFSDKNVIREFSPDLTDCAESGLKPGDNVISLYNDDISEAFDFVKTNEFIIKKELKINNGGRLEALAIVFPEIIRWNFFQDLLEAGIDESLYVKGGRQIADFSLGPFQMKPSFIEDIEDFVVTSESLTDFRYLVINRGTDEDCRKERIERLKSLEWQLKYAYAFLSVANVRFRNLSFNSDIERLRFYSTAYNYGFMRPVKDIQAWQSVRKFPYGSMGLTKKQVSYAEISVNFLCNFSTKF